MSAHTKGPWRMEGSEEDPYGQIAVFADSRLVCELWQDDAPDRDYNEEQHANARLIAAAPDLLAALNGIIGLVQLVQHRDDLPLNLNMFANHRYVEALAAIAKAEQP
jgi:hypothetical protein